MIDLSCLCGAVRIQAPAPPFVHACNCTLCAKSGAFWAYFAPHEVRVTGETQEFVRADKAEPGAELRFCARCGSATHFRLTPAAVARHGDTMMGVNIRLADEAALNGVELRYPDGRGWSGEGAFGYVREATVFG